MRRPSGATRGFRSLCLRRARPSLRTGGRHEGLGLRSSSRNSRSTPGERGADLAPHPTRGKLMPFEAFTEHEVRALIAACSTRGVTGHRNRALLAVLWRTGVRISEALELRPHDVDFKHGTVRVRLGKGLKPRTTFLSDLDALPLVERWLEERGKLQTVADAVE